MTVIGLIAAVGIEGEANFSKDDLVDILKQIHAEHAKGIAFAGASEEEARQLSRHLMKHMSINI